MSIYFGAEEMLALLGTARENYREKFEIEFANYQSNSGLCKMKVKCLENIDRNLWDNIAFQKSNVFHSYEWAEVMKKEGFMPLYLIAQENDEISGALLLLQNRPKKKLPGAVTNLFTTFTIPSEPVLINNEKETFRSLIQTVDLEALRRKAIYTKWQVLYTRFRDKEQFINNGYEAIEFGTHLLNIGKDWDVLWKGVHSKHRNSIRRAQKENIEVIESEDLRAYHELSYMTYQKSGKTGPLYEHLDNIMSSLKSRGMCRIFCAVRDNQMLAAAFILLCNKNMYYLHGASAENPLGGANLLHWRIIEWGREHGFEWYDFFLMWCI